MIHYSRNIYLGKETYDRLNELMKATGKSASLIIKELINNKYAMITHKPEKKQKEANCF